MFEDAQQLDNILVHPLNTQLYAIRTLEERMGGTQVVADINSPFCFLLEYGASLNNTLYLKMLKLYQELYPKRAVCSQDIFRHMSDYDYLNMFATPSTVTIDLILNKDKLFTDSVDENLMYKRVDIPRYSIFTLGNIKFGIPYPINIRFVKSTKTVLTTYDTSEKNPLFSLPTNLVETVEIDKEKLYGVISSEQVFYGLNLIVLRIPLYQYNLSVIDEHITPSIGYTKRFTYTDKLYAVRVYDLVHKKELHTTLSATIYDQHEPTVYLQVYEDEQSFVLHIPSVYFTYGKVSKKLRIEVYTTLGAIDYDLSTVPIENHQVNFNLNLVPNNPYCKVLNTPVTLGIQISQPKTLNGGDGYSFEELKSRTIYSNFYATTPITPSDIEKYFNDRGYLVEKIHDNLTDREYICYKPLTEQNNTPIATLTGILAITQEELRTIPTCVPSTDDSYTLLPITLFRYDPLLKRTVIVDTDNLRTLNQLSKKDKIEKYNEQKYLYLPYHVRIDYSMDYPKTDAYILTLPKIQRIEFIDNHLEVPYLLVAYAYTIINNDITGTSGYRVYLSVSKSPNLKVGQDKILVLAHTRSTHGTAISCQATYSHSVDNYDIYYFDITPTYRITKNSDIEITGFESIYGNTHYIPLQPTFDITFFVANDILPTLVSQKYSIIEGIADTNILSEYTGITRQKIKVYLGEKITEQLHMPTNIATLPKKYKTYPVDVPLTYQEDVYARDEQGVLIHSIDPETGDPHLVIEHRAGEQIVDPVLGPLYEHRAGDIMFDEYGEPIVETPRSIILYATLHYIDAALLLSENEQDITLVKKIPEKLLSYVTTVRDVSNHLIERTSLKYATYTTIGTAAYKIGDYQIIDTSLELSFKLVYYVSPVVLQDTKIQYHIHTKTVEYINQYLTTERVINMTDIFTGIKNKLSDYIYEVDVHYINDLPYMQTLEPVLLSTRPTLRYKLALDASRSIYRVPALDIEYIPYTK